MQIGLYLAHKKHAEMVVTDEKTMIVEVERFYKYTRIPVYLFSDRQDQELRCYGKIVLGDPKAITIDEFRGFRSKHRITEREKDEWWPGHLNFYAYELQVLEVYDPPKRAQTSTTGTWIRNWKWLDPPPRELHIEKVQDLPLYDPTKVPRTERGNAILRDDARILAAWWSSKKQGKESLYSFELIEEKYRGVIRELIERKAATFHPVGYKRHVRELFDRVKQTLEEEGVIVPIEKDLFARIRGTEGEEALVFYHNSLHQLYVKDERASRENIVNAHIFVVQEMRRRGIPHKVTDDLDRELQKASFHLVPFVVVDSYVSHTGSAVYGLRTPHDCDLVIRSEEDPKVTTALLSIVRLPSSKVHLVYDRRGPSFTYVPLLDLIAVPVGWKGPWPAREVQHGGIPEHSWDLYRALPPAALIEDPYVTLDGISVSVRETERNSGVELKLGRLLEHLLDDSPTFLWRGSGQAMRGKPLFKSYLVPHIPLVKVEVNEPLFRRYY